MNLGLRGKVAIVTASSRGLGKVTALALAREGASVVVSAREEKILQETAQEIQKETGSKILAIPADVTKLKNIEKIINTALKDFGRIDILVTNAGGPPPGELETFDDKEWQKAFELNFLSVVRLIRLVLPHMRKVGGGRIINMVSNAAKQPVKNLILSNAIRAGVLGMAKSVSNEVAEDNITVNLF